MLCDHRKFVRTFRDVEDYETQQDAGSGRDAGAEENARNKHSVQKIAGVKLGDGSCRCSLHGSACMPARRLQGGWLRRDYFHFLNGDVYFLFFLFGVAQTLSYSFTHFYPS